jgi:hypothetical protein
LLVVKACPWVAVPLTTGGAVLVGVRRFGTGPGELVPDDGAAVPPTYAETAQVVQVGPVFQVEGSEVSEL